MAVGHDMEIWREAAALVAVFALLGAAIWSLRHRTGTVRKGSSKSLQAVERIALTPQHAVHLLRTPGRELLVATHPQGCSLLFEQVCMSPCSEKSPHLPAQSPLAPQRVPKQSISPAREETA